MWAGGCFPYSPLTNFFAPIRLFTRPPSLDSRQKRCLVRLQTNLIQVGLCAISSAKSLFAQVFATDPQPARLELARKHGATALPLDELRPAILKATDGRGADAVLEVVGVEPALRTAMELIRPYGVVSSCGVHGGDRRIEGDLLYGKK